MSKLKIVAISDCHGTLKKTPIPECDVLTISGDFSPLQSQRKIDFNGEMCTWITNRFIPWMMKQPCRKVIFIAGNHDFVCETGWFEQWFSDTLKTIPGASEKIQYLCYNTYEFEGVTFYGCPTADIPGWAFCSNNDPKSYECPEGVDIMLVHQAPRLANLGYTKTWTGWREFGSSIMVNELLSTHPDNLPFLLLCGHIHEGSHLPFVACAQDTVGNPRECLMINVAIKGEDYEEHFPVRQLEFELVQDKSGKVNSAWISTIPITQVIGDDDSKTYTLIH